jgi:hypothetical protein
MGPKIDLIGVRASAHGASKTRRVQKTGTHSTRMDQRGNTVRSYRRNEATGWRSDNHEDWRPGPRKPNQERRTEQLKQETEDDRDSLPRRAERKFHQRQTTPACGRKPAVRNKNGSLPCPRAGNENEKLKSAAAKTSLHKIKP